MVMTPDDENSLCREHQVLLAEYGRVQQRCSQALTRQAAHINALETQVMQLRAEVMLRDTALAWQREDHARLMAAHPDLPKRFVLARHIEQLAARIQVLLRERNALLWPQMPAVVQRGIPSVKPSVLPAGNARAVLCVGGDQTAAGAARAAIETVGGRFMQHDGTDQAVLEASLAMADLVICQTGCVSHDAFWRVRDHCRRTGKQCVLVDNPDALDAVRAAQQPL